MSPPPPPPKLGQRLKCIAARRRMEERAERGCGAVSNAGPRRRGLLNGTIVCPSNRKPLFGTHRGGGGGGGMSQADPGSSSLDGCSHHTRLDQRVQAAYLIRGFNTHPDVGEQTHTS